MTTHLIASLFIVSIGFSLGWLAALLVTARDHHQLLEDMTFLEQQWQLIDEERLELHRAWAEHALQVREQRVELALGNHKSLAGTLS
jgi:hypothetical protein